MDLRLERQPPVGLLLRGELYVDDLYQCFTLEHAQLAIPLGHYRVTLTVSQRSLAGKLWSPSPDHALLQVNGVPGRTGIRFHAGNLAIETVGCILCGDEETDIGIGESRTAVTDLQRSVAQALAMHDPVWLTVVEASAVLNV